jgi:hypothetical protein
MAAVVASLAGTVACASVTTASLSTEVAARPLAIPPVHDGAPARRWAPAVGATIPLWVDSVPGVLGWSPDLVALAYDAARAWDTPGVHVRFERAATPEAALVFVHWRRNATWHVGGVTRSILNARGETEGADLWIVLDPGQHGAVLPPEAIRGLLLHELGHALGLAHDPATSAIMCGAAGPQAITERDRAALRALYNSGAGGRDGRALAAGDKSRRPRS